MAVKISAKPNSAFRYCAAGGHLCARSFEARAGSFKISHCRTGIKTNQSVAVSARFSTAQHWNSERDVHSGSIASVRFTSDYFRSSLNCRHHALRRQLPKSANSGHGTHPELEATVAEESATDVA
jgi:hypothetical protein